MEWTQLDTLAMAQHECTQCEGFGLRATRGEGTEPCPCVLRSIFRACYARFRECSNRNKHLSRPRLEIASGARGRRNIWGRKDEEYIADFLKVSRRSLLPEEWAVFSAHYLLGADWRLCCRQLDLDRGTFFHRLYRIQQKLGRVFRELQPHSLFPLDEYFGGAIRGVPPKPMGRTA